MKMRKTQQLERPKSHFICAFFQMLSRAANTERFRLFTDYN